MKKVEIVYTPKCDRCGNRYPIIESPDGLPVMLGFEMDDGEILNVCKSCICEFGENKGLFEEFLKERYGNGRTN